VEWQAQACPWQLTKKGYYFRQKKEKKKGY
jgi:hypothetical protein